jgi:5-methylcytosine-specific restriction enzyme subunit McrC
VTGTSVRLAEWQTISPGPGSPTDGLELVAEPSVRRLARWLTETRMLDVKELRAGLEIRSTSFVGRVRLGPVEITIVPKLRPESLLTLLRYAYGMRNLHLLPEAGHATQSLGFHDILVWQLVQESRELIARGLARSYARQHEILGSPRGRIDFQAMAGRGPSVEAALPCIHHKRDQDRLINRVLQAGLRLGASLASDRELKATAIRLADQLGASIARIRLDRQVFRRLSGEMDRMTRHYEAAISLVHILYEGGGLSLDEATAAVDLPGFLFDMNRFFQALLGRFLSDNLPEHVVRQEHSLTGMFAYAPGWNPRRSRAPTPRPDFVVTRGGERGVILDAKYRDLWEHSLQRDMLYQLAIYALSHDGGAATILYPSTDGQATESRIEVRHPWDGTRRALVAVRPVELARLEGLLASRTTAALIRARHEYALQLVSPVS